MIIAEGVDMCNHKLVKVASQSDGYILWALTHALVYRDQFIAGLGEEPDRG